MLEDRGLRLDDIAEIIGVSHYLAYRILTQELGVKNIVQAECRIFGRPLWESSVMLVRSRLT